MKYNDKFTGFNGGYSAKLNGAYILTHIETNKLYIGSTSNFSKRKDDHIYKLRKDIHENKNLQELYNQSPYFHFKFYLVGIGEDNDFREKAFDLEQELLDTYKDSGLLLNIGLDVRNPAKGTVRTLEEKEKISLASKEMWNDPIIRERILLNRSTEEVKLKQSNARKELWKDPIFREKISTASKDRWNNQDFRDKMTEIQNSEDIKERRSTASKEMWENPEHRTKISLASKNMWDDPIMREKIINAKKKTMHPISIDGIEYESLNEASRITGIGLTTIMDRVKSNKEKYSNYKYIKKSC